MRTPKLSDEGCEPCGDCDWCAARWRYKRDRKILMRALARAIGALQSAYQTDRQEYRENPTYRRGVNALDSAMRALRVARKP